MDVLRLGRMVALMNSNGKVRGIVAGDVFRRMVGGAHYSQAAGPGVHRGLLTLPIYPKSTRAGTVCVAHAIRSVTERRPTATTVSIERVGAFDNVSRQAILENLMKLPQGAAALPFVRMFYGSPSLYLWHDQHGHPHPRLCGGPVQFAK